MEQKHLLIVRFSALGDVLMLVPVVDALARQYPDMRITVVSKPLVESVFALLPSNVQFVGINPRNYPGLTGVWRIWRKLRALHPTHVADMHDVLRTKLIRTLFRLAKVPMQFIDKDRPARRAFIEAKEKVQQKTSFERYADVLQRLGFLVEIHHTKASTGALVDNMPTIPMPLIPAGKLRVGIAPFAAHKGKIYPAGKMLQVVERLARQGHQIYLFGSGDKENKIMNKWVKQFIGVQTVVGNQPDMAHELKLMSQLDVILTMDSGNMHLAALCGKPVISIWGATHPLGGFLGWGCSRQQVIECADMECRPCSTYGKKPCKRGDYACLCQLNPEDIVHRITHIY